MNADVSFPSPKGSFVLSQTTKENHQLIYTGIHESGIFGTTEAQAGADATRWGNRCWAWCQRLSVILTPAWITSIFSLKPPQPLRSTHTAAVWKAANRGKVNICLPRSCDLDDFPPSLFLLWMSRPRHFKGFSRYLMPVFDLERNYCLHEHWTCAAQTLSYTHSHFSLLSFLIGVKEKRHISTMVYR